MEYSCVCCGEMMKTILLCNISCYGFYVFYCDNKTCVMHGIEFMENQVREMDKNRKVLNSLNPYNDFYYNISKLFTPKNDKEI